MSIKGNAENYEKLRGSLSLSQKIRGSLSLPEVIQGKSAYEIAVMHGFEGTEEEWLESLKADSLQTNKIVTVMLLASDWVSVGSNLHLQNITISEATKNSKIDLNPSVAQLAIFHEKDLAFVVENDEGNITVWCIGQKPMGDYEMQATITEVIFNG